MRTNRLKIVGIGGGTGLPIVLRGAASAPDVDLTAIVAVSDNGGSSGRLRRGLGIPAVGDLRNCLVALSANDSLLRNLFEYRFSGGEVGGHSLGNLIVAALYQKTGSMKRALDTASDLLALRGRALACTEAAVTLCATFQDGMIARGEAQITAAGKRIERAWLEPKSPPPSPGVLEAIQSADAVVFAPGSLYTSLLPNLMVSGVVGAIRASQAIKILVCNLVTQPGETDGFSASDHLRVLQTVLGEGVVHFCIVNSALEMATSRRYHVHGSEPVIADTARIRAMGVFPVEAALASTQRKRIRHNAARLGRLVVGITRDSVRERAAMQAA